MSAITYLNDSLEAVQKIVNPFQYVLVPGDRIQIIVSALNPIAAQAFNQTSSISNTPAVNAVPGLTNNVNLPNGYLIDADGNIQFPQVGAVQLKGLTTKQGAEKIQTALLSFLKEPSVTLDVINFKVNVLGEVNRPGTLAVPDGKITILEAISQSGDLTIYGERKNILVVREKNGKREYGKLDLTKSAIFTSPYYYLEQGDVVYIPLNKNRLEANDPTEARNFRIISLVLGSVSAIAIIINALRR